MSDISDARHTTNTSYDHVLYVVPPCYHDDAVQSSSSCSENYRYHHGGDLFSRNTNWWMSIISVASAFSPPAIISNHDYLNKLNHNHNSN